MVHQGNVTYLNGILQTLLPDIVVKLRIAATHGIKGAEWNGVSMDNLGIRSVQFSHVDSGIKMKSKAQLAKERKDKVHVFSIGDKPKKVDDGKVDLHADEHVVQYMRQEPECAYSMIVHLSSRSDFFGGIVLVGKGEREKHYDDTDDEEEDKSIFDTWDGPDDVKEYEKPEFNAYHTQIQRYTPELGSALLIQSENSHGVHKVTKGQLTTLILEFWPYSDAPVGSKYQAVKDAKPLSRNEEL